LAFWIQRPCSCTSSVSTAICWLLVSTATARCSLLAARRRASAA